MKPNSPAALQASTLALLLLGASPAHADLFVDVKDIPSPGNATTLAYSPAYGRLVLKNAASATSVVNTADGTATTHLATYKFTDMSLSPSGRYVFVADYGGENIGYGTPANPSSVHRLDLADGSWAVKAAYIAGNIQAVSDDTFVLKSLDQWVTFTYNQWPANGPAVIQLNQSSGGPWGGFYAGVYSGDFRYDVKTGRLLHGNSGSSSQEIQAFKINNSNNFFVQEGSGTYGSASGYGSKVTLATDGSAFYYGSLSVDALDVAHNLHVFPETIYAATGTIAFGKSAYYDAHTGAVLGSLGFQATVYALNPGNTDFWVHDAGANLLRHFVGASFCANPAIADGTGCDDTNACTQTDTCQGGACVGSNPVGCAASDACHDVGVCDAGTGACSNPAKVDGAMCSAGICTAGVCIPSDPTTTSTASSGGAGGAGATTTSAATTTSTASGGGAGGAGATTTSAATTTSTASGGGAGGVGATGGTTTSAATTTGSEGGSEPSGAGTGCGCTLAGSDTDRQGTILGLAVGALVITARRRRRSC